MPERVDYASLRGAWPQPLVQCGTCRVSITLGLGAVFWDHFDEYLTISKKLGPHPEEMKTEKTEMIMKYFDVTYKVAKQYEIILKDKQLRQIKAWYETKKGDGTISAESEEVLKEILNKGKILKKVLDNKRR